MLETLRRKFSRGKKNGKSAKKSKQGKSLAPSVVSSDNYPDDAFTVCISVFSSEEQNDHGHDIESDRSVVTTGTTASTGSRRVRNFPVYVNMAGNTTYRSIEKTPNPRPKIITHKQPDPWDAFLQSRSKSLRWDETSDPASKSKSKRTQKVTKPKVNFDRKYDHIGYKEVGDLPSLKVTAYEDVGELPSLTVPKSRNRPQHHDQYQDIGELPRLIIGSPNGMNVAMPYSGVDQETILMDTAWKESTYSAIKVKTPLSSDPDEQEVILEDTNNGITITIPLLSTDEQALIKDPDCPLFVIDEGDEGMEATLQEQDEHPWDEDEALVDDTPPNRMSYFDAAKKLTNGFVDAFTTTIDGNQYEIGYVL